MDADPLVSIVIPVFNDEDTIGATIETCLAQSMSGIEVVCVDDASSDDSVAVIEAISNRDSRVRLIRHEKNRSAFQARRSGILAARGEHVLFVDGDDALNPSAASVAWSKADSSKADLVGFGVRIQRPDGRSSASFESRLQPRHQKLAGPRVLTGLFPENQPASGQLWRYLFRTQLLRDAYALVPDDLVLMRANDVPLMFLAAALAKNYVSVNDRLYTYNFGAGRSGQRVTDLEQAEFQLGAITSIDSIAPAVRAIAREHSDPASVLDSYASVRSSIVGHTLRYLFRNSDRPLLTDLIQTLYDRTSPIEVLVAASRFAPEAIPALRAHGRRIELGPAHTVRSILLTTMTLRTGGVSGVLLAQARLLSAAGYSVTVLARRTGSDATLVPPGIEFVEMVSQDRASRLAEWAEICRTRDIDLVVDHQILYTRDWPEYALAALSAGAATVGWVHNFAGRPIYDLKDLHSLMKENLHLLSNLVVLSPLDVAFWKLRGVQHAVYLPNPPSPLLLDLAEKPVRKEAPNGPIELIWWGRLEQRTKRVLDLIEVARELQTREVDFHLTVVGPEWEGLTIAEFNGIADRVGLTDRVEAVGPLHGAALVDAIDRAHVALSTSVIEGYPLTLPEAQSRGLPVFMYELPWLALVEDNGGIVSVPQGDAAALAAEIEELAASPARYAALSAASLAASEKVLSVDFGELYQQLVTGELPAESSPEPSLEDAQRLIDLLIFFSERNAGLLQKPAPAPRSARSARSTKRKRATGGQVDLAGSSLSHRAWRAAKPVGKRILQVFPGLRPLAHRAKLRLARR